MSLYNKYRIRLTKLCSSQSSGMPKRWFKKIYTVCNIYRIWDSMLFHLSSFLPHWQMHSTPLSLDSASVSQLRDAAITVSEQQGAAECKNQDGGGVLQEQITGSKPIHDHQNVTMKKSRFFVSTKSARLSSSTASQDNSNRTDFLQFLLRHCSPGWCCVYLGLQYRFWTPLMDWDCICPFLSMSNSCFLALLKKTTGWNKHLAAPTDQGWLPPASHLDLMQNTTYTVIKTTIAKRCGGI